MSVPPLPPSTAAAPGPADAWATEPATRFEGPRGWLEGLRYGFMGFPLAFVALPLYVVWPNHYARAYGVSLATLGALLLLVRLFDAVVDPLIGQWVDRLGRRGRAAGPLAVGGPGVASGGQAPAEAAGAEISYKKTALRTAVFTSLLLIVGFWALFFPPDWAGTQPADRVVWAVGALVVTYLAYSLLSVLHQSWGARLGGSATQRGRIVGWREGLGLAGVVVASVLPTAAGLPALATTLALALGVACLLWAQAVVPRAASPTSAQALHGMPSQTADGAPQAHALQAHTPHAQTPVDRSRWTDAFWPLRQRGFRRLLAVFVVNGMASAVPATLVLFFIQDRLQAPTALEPLFLGAYFLCAAASIALWLRAVRRWGLARTWLGGMLLSVAVFGWVLTLGAGDWPAFVAVCMLSGLALGADLVLPAALLNGLIHDMGARGEREGSFMGWWSFATKLNLALAAGVALPLLGALGYQPGQTDAAATQALTLAYGLVPCLLKLLAAGLLLIFFIRKEPA